VAESKKELVERAEAAGVEGAEDMTKEELQQRLEGQNPAELGPVVPEGQVTPEPPQAGSGTTASRPESEDDIPEAGR
jgi:hypothetical protein